MKKYRNIHFNLYIVINDVKILLIEGFVNLNNYICAKYSVVTCTLCEGYGKSGYFNNGRGGSQVCPLCYGEKYQFESKSGENRPSTETMNQVVSGTENGHEYVDMGLSVKWATMNIGASRTIDKGNYYAWAETEPKTNYDASHYKYRDENGELTKYSTWRSYGTADNKTILDYADDAARVSWGGKWCMPEKKEWNELFTKCKWVWCMIDGVKGYKVIAPNGNQIFLSAGGSSSLSGGNVGCYWSSSLYNGGYNDTNAYELYFNFSSVRASDSYNKRWDGLSIRAVFK